MLKPLTNEFQKLPYCPSLTGVGSGYDEFFNLDM